MNSYYLFMALGGLAVMVSQAIFLVLWRPGWKQRGWWWINFMLYALSIALFAVGLRTTILYSARVYPPDASSIHQLIVTLAQNRVFLVFTALMFILGSVIHLVAFLVNRKQVSVQEKGADHGHN